VLHNLSKSSNTIYVNQEQDEKPGGTELTQASIRFAFKNPQRQSKFRFSNGKHEYVLISGKRTGRAGVLKLSTTSGECLDATDLERTLIDITVRPAYAGGIERVAEMYRLAMSKINVNHLIDLLTAMKYMYPYQQSIGFLLERAGCSEEHLRKLESSKSTFDFFLDYSLRDPRYDERWRIFYPKEWE